MTKSFGIIWFTDYRQFPPGRTDQHHPRVVSQPVDNVIGYDQARFSNKSARPVPMPLAGEPFGWRHGKDFLDAGPDGDQQGNYLCNSMPVLMVKAVGHVYRSLSVEQKVPASSAVQA